jgi:hypothetical protein
MRRAARGLALAMAVLVTAAGAVHAQTGPARRAPARRSPSPRPAAAAPKLPPDEGAVYADAAARAWKYVQANIQPSGMVSALSTYHYTTVWDIGSSIAAIYCAHELGLLDDARYDAQMGKLLRTLARIDLFDGAAFNKVYNTRTGALVGRDHRPSRRGYGWSALDLGRLLLWLKVVAAQPQFEDQATAVARRVSATRVTRGGYMRGALLGSDGKVRESQEGRVGYEQYSARGLAAWGLPVSNALDLRRNSVPITVMGKTLLADVRGKDRLTAEPFALIGLELGFEPEEKAVAEQLLAAMEERHRRSGRLTMLAEDAINRAPHYFFYYCAYADGKEFTIDVQEQGAFVDAPRWVSSKAAFAWRVLFPTEYTARVLAAVMPARTPAGWGSGVYEVDRRSTGTANINTQAVILEAALFRRRGGPLMGRSR